jgi:hypothetical protein
MQLVTKGESMKFIQFKNGILFARYDRRVHGEIIPSDAVQVDDSLFFQTINETDGIWSLIDGEVVKLPFPDPAPLTASERKAKKQKEIDALEASQYMTRGEREGWLAMIEAQATSQSISLDTLYAANPFYKKLKDIDEQVTVLRADLKAIA